VAVRNVLERIAQLSGSERDEALSKLLILSGLRKLSSEIKEEVERMPILNDILDHEVIGPVLRQGIQQGIQQGMQQGEMLILRRQLEARFGELPSWVEERLGGLDSEALEELAIRVIKAKGLDEVFSHG
jgi:predicted transposase YdaD